MKIKADCYLDMDAEAQVDAVVDTLIADFNDVPDLAADAVGHVGLEYYRLARISQNEGLDAQAKEYFAKAIEVWDRIYDIEGANDTEFAKMHFRSGVVLAQELGRYQEGIDYYQTLVDNWPGYEGTEYAQHNIAVYYEKMKIEGLLPAAEADLKIEAAYKGVVENYPESKFVNRALQKLIKIQRDKGNLAEAAVYMEQFVEAYPDDERADDVLYDLGGVYEELGLFDMAVQSYHNFIGIVDPNEPRVEDVLARIEQLGGAN